MSKAVKTPAPKGASPQNPTWYGDIRHMFNNTDIAHMKGQGVDLSSYDFVKDHAGQIYQQVAAGNMPPGNPWSKEWVATFLQWMTNNCPKGTPQQTVLFAGKRALKAAPAKPAARIRKEISTLTKAELDKLVAAFNGIIAKDKDLTDPNCYFVQAGYHWLPSPNTYCMHHVPGYNPWHRAYLLGFENALRSVPGCEDVTLPYWDITKPFPDVLKKPPFDAYTYPADVGPAPYNLKGKKTFRDTYPNIEKNLNQKYDVPGKIKYALSQPDWEDFHGLFNGAPNKAIINAHDMGHNSIGGTVNVGTMTDQSIAAFDPVFWFFHCNWDRLFWQWQKSVGATTLNGLLSTINKSDTLSIQTFTVPAAMKMPPFSLTTVDIIDSAVSLDVDYTTPASFRDVTMQTKTLMRTSLSQKFTIDSKLVDVRVEGVNRLKIPGSFDVHLLKDDKVIASTGFFQPDEAEKCANCLQNAVVHFDFEVPMAKVMGGRLGVWVEPINKGPFGDRFPAKLMGNPTVEVNFMVSTE